MIPKIIHQTWRTREIPAVYRPHWVSSWRAHHPTWEYRLWTDADLEQLAAAHYPEFSGLLARARGVVRADVGRALVLHRHGGLYSDLDYMALKPMDPLLDGANICLSRLSGGYVHNALMAAAADQELLMDLADHGLKRWSNNPHLAPEFIAGPAALSRLARRINPRYWPEAKVCPIDWRKHEPRKAELYATPADYFPHASAITFWVHNW